MAQLSVWDLFFCTIEGQEGGLLFASGGDGWLTRIDKPVVLAGRMFNPESDDEMVVNEQVASQDGVHLGQVVHIQAYALDQPDATGTPHGPSLNLTSGWHSPHGRRVLAHPGRPRFPGRCRQVPPPGRFFSRMPSCASTEERPGWPPCAGM